MTIPQPLLAGSPEERAEFERIMARMADVSRRYDGDLTSAHTAVVVPSLSLHPEELAKIKGASYYEERLLFLLMVLRHPRTRVVFVTSQQVDPVIIDYYLNLLSGVPYGHARRRLTLLHTGDSSNIPLTQKILNRPRLIQRIKEAIHDPQRAHLDCFNSTPLEATLAVRLGIPLYAADPALRHLGSKTGSRQIFRAAGVPLAPGFEDLSSRDDIARSLVDLWEADPRLRKAVVKLNDGFSGAGNAIFRYEWIDPSFHPSNDQAEVSRHEERVRKVFDLVPQLEYEAVGETWEHFEHQFKEMGGIVEAWVEGEDKHSPSVQCRVDAQGRPMVVSTHDQVLGGPTGQQFLGCRFPADTSYRRLISGYGEAIANELVNHGVVGRFGIDFVVVRRDQDRGWSARAIEINLRKGGTTHPFLTLKFLTDGDYDSRSGEFYTPAGDPRYYFATDNLVSPHYRGLLPEDLIDIAVVNRLHFHSSTQLGVTFHLIGALSQFGKLGVTAIGASWADAENLYQQTVQVLDRETRAHRRNP